MAEKYNVIISGSGGMLGSELLDVFAESELDVFAFTSKKEKIAKKFSAFNNLHVFDNSEIKNLIFDTGIWINCSFPRSSLGNELANSFEFTANMIDEMKKKIVNI